MNKFRNLPALWLAVLFGLGIALLSIVPVNRIALGTRPQYFASPAAVHQAALFHEAVHILIFGVAALVAWFVTESTSRNYLIQKTLAISATIVLSFGTEWLQHVVYRQALEWNDILTNVCASVGVFSVVAVLAHFRLPGSGEQN